MPSSVVSSWPCSLRIAAAAAVADADVEVAVGAEGEWPPLWLAKGCVIVQQDASRWSASATSGSALTLVAGDHRVAARFGVVDEEAAVARVVGMEGDAEQAALAAAR